MFEITCVERKQFLNYVYGVYHLTEVSVEIYECQNDKEWKFLIFEVSRNY